MSSRIAKRTAAFDDSGHKTSFSNRAGNRSSASLDLAGLDFSNANISDLDGVGGVGGGVVGSRLAEEARLQQVQRQARRILNRNEAARLLQAVWRGRCVRKQYARHMHRTRLAREILTTERTYVNNLNVVKLLFMMPVEERFGRKELLSRVEHAVVFQNLDNIMRMQKSFLGNLERRMKTWNVESRIGDLFIDFSGELDAYQQYVNHYQDAYDTIKAHQKRKSAFDVHW